MDSTQTKTWVDLGFHVWDTIAGQVVPVIVAALVGWIAPSPQSMIQRMKKK